MAVQYLPEVSRRGAFSPDIIALNADTLPTNGIDGNPLPIGYKALLTDAPVTWKIHLGAGTWTQLDIPQSGPTAGDAVTIADGADIAEGATTSVAVQGDTNGSVNAHIRGLLIQAGIVTETAPATDTTSSGLNGRLQRIAQRITSLIALLPASLGSKSAATSLAVTASTEDAAAIAALVQSSAQVATAAAITTVADNAANVTILAANAARKGASIFNTSTAILYIKFGATAVIASSWTVQIGPGQYYEVPMSRGIYTGIIDGIWATDPNTGSAFVTEW